MSPAPMDPHDLSRLAEASPAMLWRGDTHGRCVYLNAAMRTFWGVGPEESSVFEWSSSLLSEDREAVFGPFSAGMATRQPFTCEGRYRRADGEVRVLRTKAVPYHNGDGEFVGMVGVNEDITDLRDAEKRLARSNDELSGLVHLEKSNAERLKLAINISGLAMSEHDASLRYTWALNLPFDIMNKTPSDILGPDLGKQVEDILRATLAGDPQSGELALTVDQHPLWIDIQTVPITRADGTPGVMASALDVTTRKLNEQKMQVLTRELGHRVKNVFSVVQAVIRQSALSYEVPAEFVGTVSERLVALAKAQDTLISMADERVSLQTLLSGQLSHLAGVSLEGPEVSVPGRLAPYIALAAHELGTNALKYGSLSSPDGTVVMSWALEEGDMIALSWREINGPPVKSTKNTGFGSRLLTKVFSASTGGTAELIRDEAGYEWFARVPIAPELGVAETNG